MTRLLEIRSYTLQPGTRAQFHALVQQTSLPLLERWGVDVVFAGPSRHDQDTYTLIRAYDSLEHRQHSQDTFYGSDDWRNGPREAILALIVADLSVVLELGEAALEGLRRGLLP